MSRVFRVDLAPEAGGEDELADLGGEAAEESIEGEVGDEHAVGELQHAGDHQEYEQGVDEQQRPRRVLAGLLSARAAATTACYGSRGGNCATAGRERCSTLRARTRWSWGASARLPTQNDVGLLSLAF